MWLPTTTTWEEGQSLRISTRDIVLTAVHFLTSQKIYHSSWVNFSLHDRLSTRLNMDVRKKGQHKAFSAHPKILSASALLGRERILLDRALPAISFQPQPFPAPQSPAIFGVH